MDLYMGLVSCTHMVETTAHARVCPLRHDIKLGRLAAFLQLPICQYIVNISSLTLASRILDTYRLCLPRILPKP